VPRTHVRPSASSSGHATSAAPRARACSSGRSPALRVPGPGPLRLGGRPHRPVPARHRRAPGERGRRRWAL